MKKIVTLGPKGTYSEKATKVILQDEETCIDFVSSRDEIIAQIERDSVYGVVFPLHNSSIGDVGMYYLDDVVLQTLNSRRDLQIRGSLNLFLDFALCGNRSSKRLYVHPVASRQCSDFISSRDYEVVFSSSNSQAIIDAFENGGLAITDRDLALEYGLDVLYNGVQDNTTNQTRFFYFGGPISTGVLDSSYHAYFIKLRNERRELGNLLEIIYGDGVNVEENVTRRRDCSNPRIPFDNTFMVCDSELSIKAIEKIGIDRVKKIGSFGLGWD